MQTNDDAMRRPWADSVEAISKQMGISVEKGLSSGRVRQLRKEYGPNALREFEQQSAFKIFVNQFKSLIVLLLVVAAVVSFVEQEWMDAVAICIVITINTAIGFFMEVKAVRSMESLRRMEKASARVRRDGSLIEIPAVQLVPGDIVVIEGGDIVAADMRVRTASKLQVDESMLTGESVPVSKQSEPVEADVELADRTNMMFKGTAVTRGSGEGIVTATGMNTELGKISSMVAEAEAVATPLEKRLEKLGHKLLWVTLVIIAVVALAGILRGKEVGLMIEMAIALAVAAIPEGLPVVATMALARGMLRMSRRNAMVNRLAAVETLGGTNVICTDKTGTLTQNRMTVTTFLLADEAVDVRARSAADRGGFYRTDRPVAPADDTLLTEALEICTLCNNASLSKSQENHAGGVGDPVEIALLVPALAAGITRAGLAETLPEVREDAFDSDSKIMATFHADGEKFRVAVKGAPEAVIGHCRQVRTAQGLEPLDEDGRRKWLGENMKMAEQGLRILALGAKSVDNVEADPYLDLTLVGLVAMQDPPREDVKGAVESCHKAGIKVVMVTGDQPKTAASIAAAVSLVPDASNEVIMGRELVSVEQATPEQRRRFVDASIFARVSPRQKLDLIDLHQQAGSVVAMTGDGVNDAPALKKADIGIAMGQRGTQVAREAADMVLRDDAFSTIVAAIEQGRVIFGNIRKFVLYLLSCNVSEVMIVFIASLVNAPMPITALQILFLNIVTDVFPALALGAGEGDKGIMNRNPRDPGEPIMTMRHWGAVAVYGLMLTIAVLTAFGVALKVWQMPVPQAVTISFLTLAFAQLWHMFDMRDRGTSITDNEVVRNKYAWLAIVFCSILLLLVVYVPLLSGPLELVNPGLGGWLLVLAASLAPAVIVQIFKSVPAKKSA